MTKQKLNLGIIFGGISPEHEVSIITAIQAIQAAQDNYNVVPIYIDKKGGWHTGDHLTKLSTFQQSVSPKLNTPIPFTRSDDNLPHLLTSGRGLLRQTKLKLDVLLPCLHGGLGEGGLIQALAEEFNIPLASTGLTGAAVSMDKILMKHAFDSSDIQQASYTWFYRSEWEQNKNKLIKQIESDHPYPVFVKPSRGGSSIGTTKATNKTSLVHAIDLAASLDTRILVETGITDAQEINISVMGHAGGEIITSVCEEVIHDQGKDFLDFSEKYLGDEGGKSQGMASTSRIIPAKLSKPITKKIQNLGKSIFRLLDCAGVIRIDFLIKGSDIYVIEINTIPGSLSFYLWAESGYSYPQLISYLVTDALQHHKESQIIHSFSSNILSSFEKSSGAKSGKF